MPIVWEQVLVVYTKNQAEGALPNGTRIKKVNSEPGDAHQDGAAGTVIGSIGPVETPDFTDRYVYFVVWEEDPGTGLPVGIREGRVNALKGGGR